MGKPKLYIFVGYPGAGKTTVAHIIAEITGAVHLWADHERHNFFGHRPSYSKEESDEFYAHLNSETEQLLAEGKSVIFDTNFNHFHDREHLRGIALKHGAETVLIWINTPPEVAKQRAVHDQNLRNGYEILMSDDDFDAIAAKLEPPKPKEHAIQFDGTHFTKTDVIKSLGL